jgi:UDP-N-acetylmuramyl-tripeptide synthetase
MSSSFLKTLKNVLGEKNTKRLRPFGHGAKAYMAAIKSGFPGKKIKLIGVNGTKGKTTTSILIARILNEMGHKTGFLTGALVFDGKEEYPNRKKLSTFDGATIQKTVAKMVANGCEFCVIELTSQGLEQRRHLGLGKFDTTVFLNAYPEHLEAHGGWGKYITAKSLLFKKIKEGGFFVGNYDHDQMETTQKLFYSIPFGIRKSIRKKFIQSTEFKSLTSPNGINKDLEYKGKVYPTNLFSDVEIKDLFYAIKVVENYNSEIHQNLSKIIHNLQGAPGRMEWAVKNLKHDNLDAQNWKQRVSILVDYAHEPESMRRLLETTKEWKSKKVFTKIIHVLSCDGDGRDNWKRPIHGDLSYEYADHTVLTTDNYTGGDDPNQIMSELATHYPKESENQKYYKVLNRKEAFTKALEIAKKSVAENPQNYILIFSTGVGTEFGLTQPEGVIEWSEKSVWQEVYDKF